MDAKIITTIDHFNAWGNAKNILEKIEMAGKMNELDQYISEMYPDGITGSDFNDLIGIEHDEVLQQLGIYDDIYGGEDDVIPQEESFNFNSLNKTLQEALEEDEEYKEYSFTFTKDNEGNVFIDANDYAGEYKEWQNEEDGEEMENVIDIAKDETIKFDIEEMEKREVLYIDIIDFDYTEEDASGSFSLGVTFESSEEE